MGRSFAADCAREKRIIGYGRTHISCLAPAPPSSREVRACIGPFLLSRAQHGGEITGDVSSSGACGIPAGKNGSDGHGARVTRFHHRRRRLTDVDLERINQIVVRPPSLVTPRHSRVTPAMPGTRLPLTACASGRQAALYERRFRTEGAKKTCHNRRRVNVFEVA